MTKAIKLRLGGFAIAILLVAVVIGWAAQTTWRQMDQLGEKFSQVPIESFRSADLFSATIQKLNYLLLHYEMKHVEADWNTFLSEGKKLDNWIDDQRPTLTTQEERNILDRINVVYDFYQEAAAKLHEKIAGLGLADPDAGEFANVEAQSQNLLDLAYQLAEAHRTSLRLLLSSSQRSLLLLRRLILGALCALLILGVWLAKVVYRDMIAPLYMKLVESQTIIERQEKLASLGVLAAGVAHEIRNPLTAIKARLFTQQKILKNNSPEFEDARVIGNEINRLERIVKDVLQFARPADPNLATVSAVAPLQEVCDFLAPDLEKRGIVLKLDSAADVKLQVDPQQLKQVLINLIQNSAESIGRNGTILLRARAGSEPLRGEIRPVVVLEVIDSGKGIPPEVQKRLFDPFFSTKESGTGLGLAIAGRIVEKHGGALEFQTQMNRGTTFGIVLPQAKQS